VNRRQRGLLIAKTDHIGDFILAAEAIRMLAKAFRESNEEAEVCVLVGRGVYDLACSEISMPKLSLRYPVAMLQARLFANDPALAGVWSQFVSFRHHPTLLEDILFYSIKTSSSYGLIGSELDADVWPNNLRKFNPGNSLDYPKITDTHSPRELEANRRLLSMLGVDALSYAPRLNSFQVSDDKVLLICPHASSAIRCYPIEKIEFVLAGLRLPAPWRISICVEASKLHDGLRLQDYARRQLGISTELVVPPDILTFCQNIASSGAVLSMDSAAAHIACTLKKPGVFLLGGGHYGSFGPWRSSDDQFWLTNHLPCFNCNWKCSRSAAECITEIDSSEIISCLRTICSVT
jgi:ADP-heptose:LPS heptosyltransferase